MGRPHDLTKTVIHFSTFVEYLYGLTKNVGLVTRPYLKKSYRPTLELSPLI